MRKLLVALLVSAVPLAAAAHHSTAANFTREIISVDGVIEKVRFQNPHASILIRHTDDSGKDVFWLIETEAKTTLVRRGVTVEQLAEGEFVTASGRKGKRQYTMYLRKLVFEDGSEFTSDPANEVP